jgi:hypothetical protein
MSATVLLRALLFISAGFAVPMKAQLTIPQLLESGSTFSVDYTSTTVDRFEITVPERFGGIRTVYDSSHSRSVCGDFLFSIGPRRENNIRQITLEKVRFVHPSIDLILDLNGDGRPDSLATGDITLSLLVRDEPSTGRLIQDGRIVLRWSALIDFPALRELRSDPLRAIAETEGIFDLADGFLTETTVLRVQSGVLQGMIILLFYTKPPPDIPCAVRPDCIVCLNPLTACRVSGVLGTCRQAVAGCACVDARGRRLKIYRCLS